MDKKHYWLYVLKLEDEKYYIGLISQKDPQSRIKQHVSGFYSAQWVKKHKSIETVELIDLGYITKAEAEERENHRTRQYIKKYGLNSTRGGDLSYSDEYFKIGDRLLTKDNWFNIKSMLFMMAVILIMTLLYLLK